jgi:hypothetical protein
MKSQWLPKNEREQFEILKFISAYSQFPHGRKFVIASKQETPDYFLKDSKTGKIFAVELTSVYKNDRSVPDEHMKPINGWEGIPDDPIALAKHNKKLIETIKTKVKKARKHYDTSHPLILAVYINEYISIYMEESDWEELVIAYKQVFDDVAPFSEIVLWNLGNDKAMSIFPDVINAQ